MKKNIKNTNKKNQTFGQIMGINVLSTTTSELLASVKQKISDSSKFSILTPNPELIVMAQENIDLKEALNSADFPIPDGVGLAQAVKYQSLWAPRNMILRAPVVFLQGLAVGIATFLNKKWLTDELNIIHGRKLFMDLVKLSNDNSWKVFFLGGLDNEAELAAKKLQNKYTKLRIQYAGGPEVTIKLSKDIVDKINKFKPQILFVAFGNPKQEIWIHNNLSKLNIGGAMAVGGTFRYVAGLSKLPPDWFASLGLEWFWRLITEPFRFKRIWNAVIVFPLKVFQQKITI